MAKLSEKRQIQELMRAIFSVYILEHGGTNKQAYLTMLWMSGRLEELTKIFKEHEARLQKGGK